MQNRIEHTEASLRQSHKLETVGIPEDQADVLVKVIGQQVHSAVSAAMSNMATKDEMDNLKEEVMKIRANMDNAATRAEFAELRVKLDNVVTREEFAEFRAEMKTAFRYQFALLLALIYVLTALAIILL